MDSVIVGERRDDHVLEFGCVVGPEGVGWGAMLEALRCPLNSRPFFGAAPGTTLFDGARTETEVTDDGTCRQVVRYVFRGDPDGWNTVVRPDGTRAPVTSVDGSPLYRSCDLNRLTFGPFAEGGEPDPGAEIMWPLIGSLRA